jgi:pimeloyl-ACP methyl ester carboxylesterase
MASLSPLPTEPPPGTAVTSPERRAWPRSPGCGPGAHRKSTQASALGCLVQPHAGRGPQPPVNALALVAKHPEQVRTLVAHEPPASQALPDREAILAACEDIRETYQRSGFGPAMAKFIVLVSHSGPVPADYGEQPAPDPAMFGLPGEDDGSRNDPLVGQNIITCNAYQHDFGALRAASTRVVIGVGAQSGAILPGRAAVAVAERLGTSPVTFPGGHDGFPGGEFGSTGEPDAFAATLRTVLAG